MGEQRSRVVVGVALAVGLAVGAVACSSGGGSGSDEGASATSATTATTVARPDSSCFWSDPVTVDANNTQYPDSGAAYWFSGYSLPEGATLRVTGAYPHARYASFNAYGPDPETAVDGVPVDALADVDIEPDEGSTNPFEVGADRAVAAREYTVRVVGDEPPGAAGEREANTVYGGGSDQQLIYRVYVPDDGRDVLGDAGVPVVEVELADGTVLAGDEACAALDVTTTIDTEGLPSIDEATYRSLVELGDPATHPAFDPVEWHAFFNTRHALLSTFYAHTDQEAALADVDAAKVGGFYSNADNAYVVGAVNRGLGPDPDGHNLLVLTGTAPSTPATLDGAATMADGELRYWSLCQNESPVTTRVSGCLYDEQVPVDDEGRYTIVLGLPEDRPDNATEECGVAWLDWGPGDGVSRPEAGTLLLRHLLPSADFGQAIQRIEAPGDEAAVLGGHLPEGTYTSPDDFAARGCPAG
ncbi:MAG: hypothetical protein JNK12_23255 [Acidimicrobiales bacterium]|nr:hypothetical protein [Acidimicrobiales bacterium]